MFSLLSGDDYDIGKVTGYRFVIAENYSALLDPLAEVQTLVGFQQPDEAGVYPKIFQAPKARCNRALY